MKISTADIELEVLLPAADGMNEEEFFLFCQANDTGNFEREPDGTILIMAPTGFQSGQHETVMIMELGIWNRKYKLGSVFSSNTGFTLPNKAVRSPDGAWISKERASALPDEDKDRFAHICPDFVAEIRSRTDRLGALKRKMEEYIANGCRLGFLIDPVEQKAYIYAPGTEAIEVGNFTQKLSGGEVLRGFELDLSLFLE